MNRYSVEPLANAHCDTGENPYWVPDLRQVLWTDIPNGRLFRYHLDTGRWEQFYDGPEVGGFTLQEDGSLLLFRSNEFSRMAADGTVEVLKDNIDDGMSRFNDVIADPEGRVYAGTIGKTNQSGGLYRVDTDGSVTRLFTGTGCSNGMDWSPDLRTFYWTDSTSRKIFAFDYDRATGALSNRREFLSVTKGEGTPDGMTVDTDGCIWSARWDGFGVYRYSAAGEMLAKIEFPVAKVSSAIFGGDQLDELYVTTAGGKDGSDTADGTLYRVKVPARGRPEFKSRVCLPR